MQQIYRRWLSRFHWAQVLREWFLQIYFRRWPLKYVAKVPYALLEDIAQLGERDSSNHAATDFLLIKNATLVGYSRIVLKGNLAAYDASYPDRQLRNVHGDYLFQEEVQRLMIFEPEGRLLLPVLKIHSRLEGVWLSVMCASANNWMHWLSESIPRLAVALKQQEGRNLCLLIDQKLPDNMRDVLDVFATKHPRLEIPPNHAVEVAQLIVPTGHLGVSAFWPRTTNARNGIFHFDANGLRMARDTIHKYFDCQPHKARKLFVLRQSYFRHITNRERIEQLLIARGFEVISPGEMKFEEQVRLFSEAAVVVAQAGAALANIMFMPKESTVICLSVHNKHVNYDYFREYAKIFGVILKYVLGEIDDHDKYDETHIGLATHPMNAEFSCPENELVELLNNENK